MPSWIASLETSGQSRRDIRLPRSNTEISCSLPKPPVPTSRTCDRWSSHAPLGGAGRTIAEAHVVLDTYLNSRRPSVARKRILARVVRHIANGCSEIVTAS